MPKFYFPSVQFQKNIYIFSSWPRDTIHLYPKAHKKNIEIFVNLQMILSINVNSKSHKMWNIMRPCCKIYPQNWENNILHTSN